ncbi:MAG: protein kinase [Ignavibacteriales bacterium]|nr:protein kinase [Ignavibacteriales bacterium]
MIGTTVSHYRILEKLGEGGMGVVYKAQDTNLDRFVALKFLPPHVAASRDDKARFLQEAKAVASLAHPNICTIHSVEEEDGKAFIVMEYVEGKTLKDMDQNVPLKQAVEIGTQVADGLAAAHEKGVVHRDIKPDNIMIRKDGRVQIMDFGLAKLKGVSRLTKEGSTVGTAGYMSPEQVQGQETDHRTDIFSLGVVLYELFTGESPFKGVHETAISYEIVNVDPAPLSAVKPEIDPQLDAIILECLEKEPSERYQSVAEVAKELRRFKRESSRSRVSRVSVARPIYKSDNAASASAEMKPKIRITRREFAAWILAGVLLVSSVVVAYFSLRESEVFVTRSSILPPEKTTFNADLGGHIALSPNGKLLAFVGQDSARKSNVWVRPLNALSGQMLSGTEGAQYPFWSPDSRFIGFFAGGKLRKIEASGGPPQTICEASDARGGTWNRDGVVVFTAAGNTPLSRVSAAGGSPTVLTKFDSSRQEISHRWPWFLPDGKHFLFGVQTTQTGAAEGDLICVGSLDGTENNTLLHASSNMAYAAGHVLFLREQSLMAQPFDVKSLSFTGDAFPVAEQVQFFANRNKAIFTVSDNGVLAFQTGGISGSSQLIWYDRTGKELERVDKPGNFGNFRLSPDAKNLAVDVSDTKSRNVDLWVYDLARKVSTRFTFDPAVEAYPVWSPDGNRIVFNSNRKSLFNLYQRASSGAGSEELLLESDHTKIPTDWSADGRFLLYFTFGDQKTGTDLWVLPLSGDRKPILFLQTEFNEVRPTMSPGGKWIAYQSNESGTNQVYVRPFPGPGGKYQVSTTPGSRPRWRKDGKELYYLGADGRLMAAEVASIGETFVVGAVRPLFATRAVTGLTTSYDVTADGKRFLVNTVLGETLSFPITLVVNWDAELKKK